MVCDSWLRFYFVGVTVMNRFPPRINNIKIRVRALSGGLVSRNRRICIVACPRGRVGSVSKVRIVKAGKLGVPNIEKLVFGVGTGGTLRRLLRGRSVSVVRKRCLFPTNTTTIRIKGRRKVGACIATRNSSVFRLCGGRPFVESPIGGILESTSNIFTMDGTLERRVVTANIPKVTGGAGLS